MKFRKIDENTISCILSEEDMAENNIALEDFFRDKSKVHDFMDFLIQRAKEEVGFETSGDLFSLQIMPLPKNGLAITLSDSQDDNTKGIIDQIKNTIEHVDDGEIYSPQNDMEQILQGMLEEIEHSEQRQKASGKKHSSKKKSNTMTKMRVYEFDCMDDLEQFCMMSDLEKNIKSSLYKDETTHLYYLVLEKGRLSMKNYDAYCEMAVEFSHFVSNKALTKAYFEEHFVCMIEKKAVACLCNIIGV